jgi:hypothetical protein
MKPIMKPNFNQRERATMLAALRYWQREGLRSGGHEQEIATGEGGFPYLDEAQIEALCERINVPDDAGEQSKCWLLVVRGDVEPVLMGPYNDHDERIQAAKAEHKNDIEDGLFWVDIDQHGTPNISPIDFTDLQDNLVVELCSAIYRGESVISRIVTAKYFTYRVGSDEVLLDEDMIDKLEDYLKDETVIVESRTESYILSESVARRLFTEQAWKDAVDQGQTLESFSGWQWRQAEQLPRARSIFKNRQQG